MIVAEIGINHNGSLQKALDMIDAALDAGCRYVKFQIHIPEAEMIYNEIVPSNANETIWNMMKRCSLTEQEDRTIKNYCDMMGMNYLATPFSREAADRLNDMGVDMFKIGSGECGNYPLIKHIVNFGKPIILSTGMQSWHTVDKAVELIGDKLFCLLHCVSEYPTPYDHVMLDSMDSLEQRYRCDVGLSDHSLGIYTALAAITKGAKVIEKHFTLDKNWEGPDQSISLDPVELKMLVEGEKAIHQALIGQRTFPMWAEEKTAEFAFHSVVTIKDVKIGETFTEDNIWVKRPGGGIPASQFETILGKRAKRNIDKDVQLKREDIG